MNVRSLLVRIGISCLAIPACVAAADATPAAATVNTLVIHADRGTDTISRNIYGQFAEHLGHCIYDGIWVGEDSRHPEHPRHPQRRRGRAAENPGPGRALAGRLFRGRVPLEGRDRAARQAARR